MNVLWLYAKLLVLLITISFLSNYFPRNRTNFPRNLKIISDLVN